MTCPLKIVSNESVIEPGGSKGAQVRIFTITVSREANYIEI